MKELFLPYQESLELKELGFKEDCFYVRIKEDTDNLYTPSDYQDYPKQQVIEVLAPLYSQAFKFFRDKYNLFAEIKVEDNVFLGEHCFYWSIFGEYSNKWIRCLLDSNGEKYKTHEEAELACIKYLIKHVKEK